jgi:broad specificity phosphatase PhoE
MATLLLLRHGETELNRRGILRGHVDVPLSGAGELEATRLAKRVRDEYSLTRFYTSPLLRARSTAEAIARTTGVPPEIDARFIDLDYGEWAGRPIETLSPAERAAYLRWRRRPDTPLPGAEDPKVAQQRALEGLMERAGSGDDCLAVVSHDAILQLLLCRMLGIELRSYLGLVQHTAALNELARRGDSWTVVLLNSSWHLDGNS